MAWYRGPDFKQMFRMQSGVTHGDLDIVSIAWDDYRFLHLWRNDAVCTSGR
jgi:hypothetical protein